jgi:hypothetical protein
VALSSAVDTRYLPARMKVHSEARRLCQMLSLVAVAGTAVALALLTPTRSLAEINCLPDSSCDALVNSTVTCVDGRHVQHPFNCNYLCQNPDQDTGKRCATFDDNPCAQAVCGSAGECGDSETDLPSSCDDHDDCTIDTCDPCVNDCSGACIHQPDFSAVLAGSATCADGRHVMNVSGCNDLCQDASQDVGKFCATFDSNLCVKAVCGSALECNNPTLYVPPSCDDHDVCTIDTCELCGNNRSGACVHQPDLSMSGCNLIPGESCGGAFQCASGFCVEGACCNRACDGPAETCNVPGRVGTCVEAAATPLLSGRAVLFIVCLLAAIGLFGLRRAVIRPRG